MMIGNAQRDVIGCQQTEDFRRVPTGLAKFEAVAALPRKQLAE
jgi:hypothetical protein